MNRSGRVAVASVAIAVLATGGCGSAGRSGSATTPTAPAARLDLAPGGRALSASAQIAGPALFPVQSSKYVLDASLPDLGPSAVVWRMSAHSVDAADVQRFATVLDVSGSPTRTSTGWEVRTASAILSFFVGAGTVEVSYASGGAYAAGGSSGSVGAATPPGPIVNGVLKIAVPVDVPDAAGATTIARALLDRLGVLAGQDWSSAVDESAGAAVSCAVRAPCPSVPPVVSARTVTFGLLRDGMRVDRAEWSVTIGEHHTIESLGGQWATPTLIGSYPLRSTAGVFADLQRGAARYAGPQPMMAMAGTPAVGTTTNTRIPAITVHVIGVSLGVAPWDAYDSGRASIDLVPTYRFHAHVGNGGTYDIEVLALDTGTFTFTSPRPSPTPGPLPAQSAPRPAPSSATP